MSRSKVSQSKKDLRTQADPSHDTVELLKILANENRFALIEVLVTDERSVGELEQILSIRQPTLSQQLAELRRAGLVTTRRDAKQIFYRLADRRLIPLLDLLRRDFSKNAPHNLVSGTVHSRQAHSGAAHFAKIVHSDLNPN